MWVDARHRREKARIRHPQHARASVVVGDVAEQPLDGVVRIGALVDALRIRGIVQRPVHEELALTAEAPANVLRHEDVAVGRKETVIAANVGIAGDAVRRPRNDERQRA